MTRFKRLFAAFFAAQFTTIFLLGFVLSPTMVSAEAPVDIYLSHGPGLNQYMLPDQLKDTRPFNVGSIVTECITIIDHYNTNLENLTIKYSRVGGNANLVSFNPGSVHIY